MSTHQVTIELPYPVYRQFARIAVETLITQSVVSNLPPSTDNAPLEMQLELVTMQKLGVSELLSIAHSQVESKQHQRHVQLLEKNQEGVLNDKERQELTKLRLEANRLMLRKAYVWSILRWRGVRIPRLQELPVAL